MGAAPALGAVIAALGAPPSISAAPASPELAICGAERSAQETLFLRQQRVLHEPGLRDLNTHKSKSTDKLSRLSPPVLAPIRRSQDTPPVPTSVGEIAIIEATPRNRLAPESSRSVRSQDLDHANRRWLPSRVGRCQHASADQHHWTAA